MNRTNRVERPSLVCRLARRTRLVTLAAAISAVAVVALAAPAAADSTGASSTDTQTSSGALLGSARAFWAAGAALLIGLIAIAVVLYFLYRDRTRSFRELDLLIRLGRAEKVDDQPSISTEGDAALAPAVTPAAPTAGGTTPAGGAPTLQIQGPDSLVVGKPMTYLAVADAADSVHWSVQGQASLSTSTGSSVTVTAQGSGALRITATGTDGTPVTKSIVVAQPPATKAYVVPFLGPGYGSVVIALAVASVTAALGLTSVISGEAVATILGALVSYSIAKSTSSSPSDSASSGAPATNGSPASTTT